jgi:uncharacterized low-complexity protein
MKRSCILFIVVIVSLLSLIAVHAQDSEATPKPGTRADNECYAGGTMDGKCGGDAFHADGSHTQSEVDWAWKCGYYMARFNDGKISRSDVPSECGILLPGLPLEPLPACIVAFGGIYTECLSGGIISQDAGSDGTFESSWYVISSPISGDGGACPAGSTYSNEVGNYTGTPDFYAFMLSHGYKATDDFCRIP